MDRFWSRLSTQYHGIFVFIRSDPMVRKRVWEYWHQVNISVYSKMLLATHFSLWSRSSSYAK
jgi:hypothetical protein